MITALAVYFAGAIGYASWMLVMRPPRKVSDAFERNDVELLRSSYAATVTLIALLWPSLVVLEFILKDKES